MLLWLTDWLAQFDPAFGVARYLTLRAILSVLTALGITMLIGPVLIRKLGVRQIISQSVTTTLTVTSVNQARPPWVAH